MGHPLFREGRERRATRPYDLSGNVLFETQGTSWVTAYLYLGGSLRAQYKNGTTSFLHRDHLGSTRLMTAAGPSTRIQSTGGTNTWKYYTTGVCPGVSGVTYTVNVWVKNQGTTSVKIGGNIVDGPVIAPGATQQVSFTETGNGASCIQLGFVTLNPGDPIDVLAFAPALTVSGSNLIPTANQNFSGWNSYQGSSVTVTQGQIPMIVDSMDFLPYGEQIAGDTSTTHKFTGKERDNESGLDYFGARYYSSGQGRFITPDPIHFQASMLVDPQRFNLYAYVRNNPLRFVDPKGEAIELTGNDEQRAKELKALQSAVGQKAGSYLYENTVKTKNKDGSTTTKYFVGIKSGGPDGKGPSFGSINPVAQSLGNIINAHQIAQAAIVPQETQVGSLTIAPTKLMHIPVLGDINVGGTPAATMNGKISMLDPDTDPGQLPGSVMSDGQRGSLDWGMIFMHELGHGSHEWGIPPVTETSNDRAVFLENQVRQLRDPLAPTRKEH